MRKITIAVLAASAILASYSLASAQKTMTPQQYHKESGPCAWPDDKDKAGKKCGKRSAFCKAGGPDIQCFKVDVEKRKKDACG